MIALVCGPTRRANRLGGDRDGLVDIDDHRNGANRQNGRRRRHISVGRNEDFVAWADAHARQARHEFEGPAGRKREMIDAEIGRVALLEGRALALFAVAEKLARPDHAGDRLDLLLADDIHWRQLLARVNAISSGSPQRRKRQSPAFAGSHFRSAAGRNRVGRLRETPWLARPVRPQCRGGTPARRRRTPLPGSRSPTRRTGRDSFASRPR